MSESLNPIDAAVTAAITACKFPTDGLDLTDEKQADMFLKDSFTFSISREALSFIKLGLQLGIAAGEMIPDPDSMFKADIRRWLPVLEAKLQETLWPKSRGL